MRTSAIALALVLALPLVTHAAEPLPRLRKEQDYARTRQTLQSLGWMPVTLPGADICQGGDARCQGRPEMFICAGTGMAQCIFTWRRGATVIEIVTVGEGPALFDKVGCR